MGFTGTIESLDWLSAAAVVGTGLVAGFFNVTAGGGSMLTLPLLVLLGLPGTVANGTNRVALVLQNVVAVSTFRRGGVRGLRSSASLIACALPGVLLGAWAGATVPDALFRRLLGLLMIALTVVILMHPRAADGDDGEATTKHRLPTLICFGLLGFYAGFVQAGIGFLIVFALSVLERIPLVRAHALKVTFVLAMQLVALAVFAFHGKVAWGIGLLLAIGLATGGYIGARFALASNERLLRGILVVAALALSARMLLG